MTQATNTDEEPSIEMLIDFPTRSGEGSLALAHTPLTLPMAATLLGVSSSTLRRKLADAGDVRSTAPVATEVAGQKVIAHRTSVGHAHRWVVYLPPEMVETDAATRLGELRSQISLPDKPRRRWRWWPFSR